MLTAVFVHINATVQKCPWKASIHGYLLNSPLPLAGHHTSLPSEYAPHKDHTLMWTCTHTLEACQATEIPADALLIHYYSAFNSHFRGLWSKEKKSKSLWAVAKKNLNVSFYFHLNHEENIFTGSWWESSHTINAQWSCQTANSSGYPETYIHCGILGYAFKDIN